MLDSFCHITLKFYTAQMLDSIYHITLKLLKIHVTHFWLENFICRLLCSVIMYVIM